MRAETSYFAKKYMKYLKENEEINITLEEDFDTEWEKMYYVFIAIFKIPEKEALSLVDDFRSDFMLNSISDQ